MTEDMSDRYQTTILELWALSIRAGKPRVAKVRRSVLRYQVSYVRNRRDWHRGIPYKIHHTTEAAAEKEALKLFGRCEARHRKDLALRQRLFELLRKEAAAARKLIAKRQADRAKKGKPCRKRK